MRRIQGILLLSLLLIIPGLVQAKKGTPWEQKLPFKNLTIKYDLTGMEKGTETLYIKDHGQKSATYRKTVTSMMGVKMENNTIEIMDPEWVYNYNLTEGTGTKTANPNKYMKEEFEKLTSDEKKAVLENSEKMGGDIMHGMGGEIEQNVTKMFGFDCDRVNVIGSMMYNIHNTPIALKMEANIMGIKMNQVATSVEKGKVDNKVFKHPEGIEAVFDAEADAMARKMAKNALDWLKDPESAQVPQMNPGAQQERMEQIPQEDQEMMKQAEQMMEGLKGMFGN
jgi:hypothetical protein